MNRKKISLNIPKFFVSCPPFPIKSFVNLQSDMWKLDNLALQDLWLPLSEQANETNSQQSILICWNIFCSCQLIRK